MARALSTWTRIHVLTVFWKSVEITLNGFSKVGVQMHSFVNAAQDLQMRLIIVRKRHCRQSKWQERKLLGAVSDALFRTVSTIYFGYCAVWTFSGNLVDCLAPGSLRRFERQTWIPSHWQIYGVSVGEVEMWKTDRRFWKGRWREEMVEEKGGGGESFHPRCGSALLMLSVAGEADATPGNYS